jgi:hypothetical protein
MAASLITTWTADVDERWEYISMGKVKVEMCCGPRRLQILIIVIEDSMWEITISY